MRRDLDRILQQRGLGGIVVFAHDRYSPAMYYASGQKLNRALYFRAADGRAHLITDPMERDDAAKVGCPVSTLGQHGLMERVEEHGMAGGHADLIAETLATLDITGRIGFYGDMEAAFAYELLTQLRERSPGIEIDRSHPDVLAIARATKDAGEIAAIRRASEAVLSAWSALRDHLGELRRAGDHYVNGGGPVTLGHLRALLHEEFLHFGLEGGESIVAQGRDAGVPHNRGNDRELLRTGAPVIVDIFPGEAGGGYHSDFTRTFCMGRAPDDLKRLHDDCRAAFDKVMGRVKVGEPCRDFQVMTCEEFERRGHPTVMKNQAIEEGYVHGLGHGVGLDVHEAPRLGGPPSNTQLLEAGMVVTIEPGLYYPSRGMGVRIEDLVVMTDDGGYENLTPAPYDLEIEAAG